MRLIVGTFMSKKNMIIIIASVLAVIVVIIGGVFVFNAVKSNNEKNRAETAAKNSPAAKKATADTKKLDGVKALTDGDTDKAKQLLTEARVEYEAIKDNDNKIDTEAQLYFIEHPSTPPAASSEVNS